MIQMASQWETFGWAPLVLLPLIFWTDKERKKNSMKYLKEVIEQHHLILGLDKQPYLKPPEL